MAIQFGDNINYKGKKPLDSRSFFSTIAEMSAYSENYLPPVFLCQNEEDGNLYQYNVNNEVDATTGKWRKFEGGGSVDDVLKQVETLPEDASDGDIYQYVGESTSEYINGHIYKKRIYDNVYTLTYRCYRKADGTGAYAYINSDELKYYTSSTKLTTISEIKALSPKPFTIVSLTDDTLIYNTGSSNFTKVRFQDDDISEVITEHYSYWMDLSGIQQIKNIDSNYNPVVNSIIQYVGENTKDFQNGLFYKYLSKVTKYWKFVNEDDDSDIIYYKADNYDTEPEHEYTLEGQLFIKENGNFVPYHGDDYEVSFFGSMGQIEIEDFDKGTDYTYQIDTFNPEYETEDNFYWEEVRFGISISKSSGNAIIQSEDGIYAPSNYLEQIDDSNIFAYTMNSIKLNKIIQYTGKYETPIDATGESSVMVKTGQVCWEHRYRTFKCYKTTESTVMPKTIYLSDNTENKKLLYKNGSVLKCSSYEYDTIEGDTVTADGITYTLDSSSYIEYPIWEILNLGGDNTAESVTYSNDTKTDWDNVKKALDGLISKVYYVAPSITSFTMTPATTDYEVGLSVASLDFAWAYNKEITTQSLTDATLELTDRTATITGPFTTNKTFTLTCGDGEKTATASKSIAFKNKIYYGSAAVPGIYDSAFILGLSNKQFATAKKGSYTVTVADGEYGFIASPKSFGKIESVYIGGFETTVEDCGEISFTNASGGVVDYYICRTGRCGLGNITMEVK